MSTRAERESSQPLLNSQHSDHDALFAVEDETYESPELRETSKMNGKADTPTFAPPLRSTQQSRETGMPFTGSTYLC